MLLLAGVPDDLPRLLLVPRVAECFILGLQDGLTIETILFFLRNNQATGLGQQVLGGGHGAVQRLLAGEPVIPLRRKAHAAHHRQAL